MVDVSAVSDMVMNVITFILAAVAILGIAAGIFFLVRYFKRWSQFEVRVWGKDAFGQLKETVDKAGVFVDPKTKNKRFWLRKGNVGLDPDNVPVIYRGEKRIVYVRRLGLKNFRYMTPILQESLGMMEVGDEDVNWAINAYEREKKKFIHETLLQYMPYIALGFVSIVILIMVIWVLKQFDVLKEVAIALQGAAQAVGKNGII